MRLGDSQNSRTLSLDQTTHAQTSSVTGDNCSIAKVQSLVSAKSSPRWIRAASGLLRGPILVKQMRVVVRADTLMATATGFWPPRTELSTLKLDSSDGSAGLFRGGRFRMRARSRGCKVIHWTLASILIILTNIFSQARQSPGRRCGKHTPSWRQLKGRFDHG